MLNKSEIVKALREIGALLELKKESPYKVSAYKRGANSLEMMDDDFEQFYRDKRLNEISGVGATLASIIDELCKTGKSEFLDELKSEMPSVPIDLVGIPGLDLKRLELLKNVLGISSRDQLLQACQDGLLSPIKGLGSAFEKKLLANLNLANGPQRIILSKALELSKLLLKHMEKKSLVVETAGEVRRWQEVITNIEIVACTDNLKASKNHFERFGSFVKCEWISDTTGVGYFPDKMIATIHLCRPEQFVNALFEKTGSLAHIQKLKTVCGQRQSSSKKQSNQSSYSEILEGAHSIEHSESDLYRRMKLPYIPPELREDWGEIEEAIAGKDFSDLIEQKDIQGMVHCHTNFSDGNTTVEMMARAAEKMGFSYITITDHSPTAFYANGLNIERLKEQWESIDRAQEQVKIRILRGTESDITAEGFLDYPDTILEKFDIIIASIHARYKMDEDKMTNRIKTCMELPVFKIWGHALGRLLLKRDPVPCRVEEVLGLIANSAAAIEINGDPHRMDLEPFWIRKARDLGIKFVISTDAHSTADLHYLPFGVHMARRGGLTKNDVLNTLPCASFKKAVRPSR